MTRFRTGLVVGKFCPLHRGHQHLLDEAAGRCDRLVILSYTKPEFDGFGPELRERWLAALYPGAIRMVLDDARVAAACGARGLAREREDIPGNDAPDDAHRRFVAWVLQAIAGVDADAVFTSEAYGEGFAAFLSAAQVERGGPPVVHVPVDPGRIAVPVSGTAIRRDVHAMRQWLAPVVYRDFVRRVAILGGESTGKSTLARELAGQFGTVFAAEYGRELWDEKGGGLEAADMLRIADMQARREDGLLERANAFVFCDSTPLTTMLYSEAMFGNVPPALAAMAERRYDIVFLCAPDVPFVQDGTRRDEAFRQWQHAWYLRELSARGIDFELLQGPWEQRLARALEHVKTSARRGRR